MDQLFLPWWNLRAGIFLSTGSVLSRGKVYGIYHSKPPFLFSHRQLDSAGPIRTSRETRQKPVSYGVPSEGLRCWTHEPNSSLPWEKLRTRGSLPDHKAGTPGRVPRISILASLTLLFIFTWGAEAFQLVFVFLTMGICPWIIVALLYLWAEEESRASYCAILLTSLLSFSSVLGWKINLLIWDLSSFLT